MADGNVPCPKDRGVNLGLEARADDGSSVAIDASRVTWQVDAAGPTVSLTANGATASATATKDWFDASPPGAEPATDVTACYDGVCDTVAVVGVTEVTRNPPSAEPGSCATRVSLPARSRAVIATE